MKTKLVLLTVLAVSALGSIAKADAISVVCGDSAKHNEVVFGSESFEPEKDAREYWSIGVNGVTDNTVSIAKTTYTTVRLPGKKKERVISGYVVSAEPGNKPTKEYVFSGLESCGGESDPVGQVQIFEVGGVVGRRLLQTVEGCTCDSM